MKCGLNELNVRFMISNTVKFDNIYLLNLKEGL